MMSLPITLKELERVNKQHRTLLVLHSRLPKVACPSRSLGNQIQIASSVVQHILALYRDHQSRYRFEDPGYVQKIQNYISILDGCAVGFELICQKSSISRLLRLPRLQALFEQLSDRISEASQGLLNIPFRPSPIHSLATQSISSNLLKEQEFRFDEPNFIFNGFPHLSIEFDGSKDYIWHDMDSCLHTSLSYDQSPTTFTSATSNTDNFTTNNLSNPTTTTSDTTTTTTSDTVSNHPNSDTNSDTTYDTESLIIGNNNETIKTRTGTGVQSVECVLSEEILSDGILSDGLDRSQLIPVDRVYSNNPFILEL